MPTSHAIVFVCISVLLCIVAAAAYNKKDELFRQAKAAEDAEDLAAAARLYCRVAEMDADYKDAQTMCEVMREESIRVAKRYEDLFKKGVTAFEQGHLEDAERNFRNVRKGLRVAEAQQYLARITSARQAKASADAEQASASAFSRGEQAFRRNDFSAAKAAFAQVEGTHHLQAQSYLSTISRYEHALAAGDQALAIGDFQGALAAYHKATGLKSDGPGDPASRIAQIETRIEADRQAAAAQQKQEQLREVDSGRGTSSKAETQGLLKEAGVARRRGDKSGAKAKYQRVLAADPKNKTAIRAIAQLAGGSERTAALTRSEALLATALRDFYAGDYLIAEVRLQDYLHSGGQRKGVTYFFLGTCKMSRYYISDSSEETKNLLMEAQDAFRMAAKTPGFIPPGAEYVSPKILKAYAESNK